MYKCCSCCQTAGLPQSGGRVPDRQLWSVRPDPSCRNPRAGQEPLLPQKAGSVPVRGISCNSSVTREGNALPQLAGKLPVWHIHYSHKAVHGLVQMLIDGIWGHGAKLRKADASEQSLRNTKACCSESSKASAIVQLQAKQVKFTPFSNHNGSLLRRQPVLVQLHCSMQSATMCTHSCIVRACAPKAKSNSP